jgi:tetratricopeptide (TPR) repeat protein
VAWAAGRPAPYALDAFARWAALLGVAAGATVVAVERADRQRLLEAVAGGAAVVSLIGLVQHLELARLPLPVISAPGSTFGNRNLAAEAVAMALPLGCAAAAGAGSAGVRRALAAAVGLSLVYLGATRARGAWLGAALGLATLLLVWRPRLPRRAALLAAGAAALAAAAAILPGRINPMYVHDAKRYASGADVVSASFDPQSTALRTRLGLWRRGLALWRDHPLLGVGPGNWPVLFPRYAEPGASRDGVLTLWVGPRQAHDDLLERAGETGLVGLSGLAAFAVAAVLVVRARLRSAPDERPATAAAAGALAALAGSGLTGFPLEMPATIGLAGLALGLLAPAAAPAPRTRAARIVAVVGAVALMLVAGVRAERRLRGNALLGEGERALRDPRPEGALRALPALGRAAALTPGTFAVHARTAEALLRLGRHAEAADAIRRALGLEPLAPNGWATLAAAELGAGHPMEARASAARALALLSDHPFAARLAALAAEATGDRDGARASWARLRAIAADPAVDVKTAAAARALLPAAEGRLVP